MGWVSCWLLDGVFDVVEGFAFLMWYVRATARGTDLDGWGSTTFALDITYRRKSHDIYIYDV